MNVATKPIPVRIPEDWVTRLDKAAHKLGTNRAALISFCAQTFAKDFEQHGEAMMPMDWQKIFRAMDGRTAEASKASALNDSSSAKPSPASKTVAYKLRRRNKPDSE